MPKANVWQMKGIQYVLLNCKARLLNKRGINPLEQD
jgi:hypothetical protein